MARPAPSSAIPAMAADVSNDTNSDLHFDDAIENVPDGWFGADDWRLQSLRQLNTYKDMLDDAQLDEIAREIMLADDLDDIPPQWSVTKGGAGGSSSDAGSRAAAPSLNPSNADVRKMCTQDARHVHR